MSGVQTADGLGNAKYDLMMGPGHEKLLQCMDDSLYGGVNNVADARHAAECSCRTNTAILHVTAS